MKKVIYIFGLFTVLAVMASCEKEVVKPIFSEDSFESGNNKSSLDNKDGRITPFNKGSEGDGASLSVNGGITDPNNDKDYDGIVDPNNDEDFDIGRKGK